MFPAFLTSIVVLLPVAILFGFQLFNPLLLPLTGPAESHPRGKFTQFAHKSPVSVRHIANLPALGAAIRALGVLANVRCVLKILVAL